MFGHEHLVKVLNENIDEKVHDIDNSVRVAVENFEKGEDQFDDITTLCIRYNGIKDQYNKRTIQKGGSKN